MKKPSSPKPAFRSNLAPTHDQIAHRAHELWLRDGQPDNRELDHWLTAERELADGSGLRDDVVRLNASPMDPASAEASELENELDRMVEPPARRSATSLI